jgi:hypothetical protein
MIEFDFTRNRIQNQRIKFYKVDYPKYAMLLGMF